MGYCIKIFEANKHIYFEFLSVTFLFKSLILIDYSSSLISGLYPTPTKCAGSRRCCMSLLSTFDSIVKMAGVSFPLEIRKYLE